MIDNNQQAVVKPSDLPSPPKAALEILRICTRPDVDNAELARLVTNDPLLTAELLRVVNSPFYGIAREVRSVKQAIVILGIKALRNLALCISVRDVVKADELPGFAIDLFWEDSLRRACCARMLAQLTGANVDDCFTAGLLQDFGLLVMFYLNKDKLQHWLPLRLVDPDQRYRQEIELFYTTHDAMIEMLATQWGLPQDLVQALGTHHKLEEGDVNKTQVSLTAVLQCADWLSSVFSVSDVRETINQCRDKTLQMLGLDIDKIESILFSLPELIEKAASALGLRITHPIDFNQLMQDANVKLAKENQGYQELNWKLEKAIKERDALASELNFELYLAREVQLSLLPKQRGEEIPVTGINVSARLLSGDFYDYFPISGERFFFILGDVSGKGINAALLMTKVCSLFRCLGKTMHDLEALMALINDEIYETSVGGMFAMVVAGIYEPATGRTRLINAGNPPALLIYPEGKVQSFPAQAPPLGISAGTIFKEVEFSSHGGSLYLYSDGVIESHTESGKGLGMKGLMTHLLALRNKPLQQRLEAIVQQLTSFTDKVHDDITLLALEGRTSG